jgi:hypothetical protein
VLLLLLLLTVLMQQVELHSPTACAAEPAMQRGTAAEAVVLDGGSGQRHKEALPEDTFAGIPAGSTQDHSCRA